MRVELLCMGDNSFGQIQHKSENSCFVEPVYCFERKALDIKSFFKEWNVIGFVDKAGNIQIQGSIGDQLHQELKVKIQDFDGQLQTIQDVFCFDEILIILHDDHTLKTYSQAFKESDCYLKEIDINLETANTSMAARGASNSLVLHSEEKDGMLTMLHVSGQTLSLKWELPFKKAVVKVGCGKSFQVLVTKDGQVFTWGIGSRGQLGHGGLGSFDEPKLIETLGGVYIKDVSCGGWHALVLADSNDVYSWGWNQHGQTGFPAPTNTLSTSTHVTRTGTSHDDDVTGAYEPVAMVTSPLLLELESYVSPAQGEHFLSIRDVSCGTRHSAIVTSCGRIVTWGWGKFGQLGHECCRAPQKEENFNDSMLPPCGDKPHPPSVARWYTEQNVVVDSVVCKHWNTFVFVRS